jgi:hypothetical protein
MQPRAAIRSLAIEYGNKNALQPGLKPVSEEGAIHGNPDADIHRYRGSSQSASKAQFPS